MTLYTTTEAAERLRAKAIKAGDHLAELGDWRGALDLWTCTPHPKAHTPPAPEKRTQGARRDA